MSHPHPSFNPDYTHQGRWHDGNVEQGHPGQRSAPYWAAPANIAPNNQSRSTYSNDYSPGPGAWPNSPVIVDNELVWAPGRQYPALGSPGQHAYASQGTHIHHDNGVHRGQYRQDTQNGYYAAPVVAETYSHRVDNVARPIKEHQYQYGADAYYSSEAPGHPRGRAADSHMSSQVATTDVPDEYRASIARHCDAIHASGSHGLESDNGGPTVYAYRKHLPYKEEEPEPTPVQSHTNNKGHSEIAVAAYDSLVKRRTYANHVPVTNVDTESLMEPHMKVPSQQRLMDFMHEKHRLNQRPRSPVVYFQPIQTSPVKRQSSTPPPDATDFVLSASGSYKQPITSNSAAPASSRQGLEHEVADESSPDSSLEDQQPSPPTPYPGSSQSVLKLTTTKKVAEKKQALACLFCRERKIACGRPDPENVDQTCNQCARRHITCEYPKESRRGQHKRTRRKKTHDHDVNASSPLSGQ